MKRKKRLKRGIKSLKKQVELHEKKLKDAKEKGYDELVRYYEKDIARLKKEEERKEEQLEKQ